MPGSADTATHERSMALAIDRDVAVGLGPAKTGKARVDAVAKQFRQTARSLGLPRIRQGAGLINADAATSPAP